MFSLNSDAEVIKLLTLWLYKTKNFPLVNTWMFKEYLNLIQTVLSYLQNPAEADDFGSRFRSVHAFSPPETRHCEIVYFLTQLPTLIDFDSGFVSCC